MFTRLFKVLALSLLLILPIQGIAAALGPILCAGSDGHHSMGVDSHSHGDDGVPHSHDNKDGPVSDESAVSHLCCHHFSAGVPFAFEELLDLTPTLASRSVVPPHKLFIPEQPQRPPRLILV